MALWCLELCVGQHTLFLELAKFLQLGQLAIHVTCWRGRGRGNADRLLLFVSLLLLVRLRLFLVSPPAGLPWRDAVGGASNSPKRSGRFDSLPCCVGYSGLRLRSGLGLGASLGGID
jgi:hypothetical protein